MFNWLKSLICEHNKVATVIYYVTNGCDIEVYEEYTCNYCGKRWRKYLSRYSVWQLPYLIQQNIKSIEEVYNERANQ